MFNVKTQTALVAAIASLCVTNAASAASFTGLGFLPSASNNYSFSGDISQNGLVVAGQATNSAGQQEAFRWTAATGMQGLGILSANPSGNLRSYANGISADGSVIVGGTSSPAVTSTSSSATEAFRWTAATGMVGLGMLPGGGSSNATGVSNDGNAVVAYGAATGYTLQSAIWTPGGGLQGIGDIPGGTAYSYAWTISGDGSTISSLGVNSSNQTEAFKWTQAGGLVAMGIPAGNARSETYGMNDDGSIIVGAYGISGQSRQAAYWTESGGWVGLGSMGYNSASASGVSDDGNMIIGSASTFNPLTSTSTGDAFLWDPVNGMRSADLVLSTVFGLNLTGWDITSITGISGDGRFLAGSGIDPNGKTQAWMADLTPVPVPGAVWLFGSAIAGLSVFGRRKA